MMRREAVNKGMVRTMKTFLLTITLFVLNSCTTADYWFNHMFVVPENPFEQKKIMRVYITNIPPIHPPKDKPDFCIETDVKIENTQDIAYYLEEMSRLMCNRRSPILKDSDLF